ncbi:hypothetical protein OGAPHI_002876 [Ogataea philodendri]|uniref:Uncharacterized protein n=1 Tax=Ogataea philodendri TaxID=1378263 RepID=A0A9P8P9F8_9ASCO|nr:uncharacterized protein OGAPHI_002876 [Ogataea philodendri]KAH3667227.1 hypothetical protein OGAPHI_002876 [Ogataea philodendri]
MSSLTVLAANNNFPIRLRYSVGLDNGESSTGSQGCVSHGVETALHVLSWRDETRRLTHIDFLIKSTVEKGSGNIHLMNLHFELGSKAEHYAHTVVTNNRTKGLIVVKSMDLTKTLNNKPCFQKMRNGFGSEYPTTSKRPSTRRKRDQRPDLVMLMGGHFGFHGREPTTR